MTVEQSTKDVSFLTRFLVSIYVNAWIPLRLSYLRLKFKVIPYVRPTILFISFSMIMILAVPIALIMLSGFLLTLLGHTILKVICYPFDIAADQEPGSAYNSLMSVSMDDIMTMSRIGEVDDECEEENHEEEEPEKEEDVVQDTIDFIEKISSEIAKQEDAIPEPVMIPIPSNAGFHDANEDGIQID